jgi:hypothetical protein
MAGEIKGMVSFLVQQSVGLSADYRTHRRPAGGGSVLISIDRGSLPETVNIPAVSRLFVDDAVCS